jgi:hypothetical protein
MVVAALALAGCYDDLGVYPDPGYVAVSQPYYYEGRPAYYYGNRWVYRDGGRWNHYRVEPPPLRVARSSSVRVVGRTYERRR